MKKKTVVASLMTIAMCASVITGATFALFTSESKTSIAITSGKVNVVATVDQASVYSKSLDKEYQSGADNTYAQGVVVGESSVELNNFVPGDGVKFTINVTNESSVAVQYRTLLTVENDNGLFDGLTVTIDGATTAWDGFSAVSEWAPLGVGENPTSVAVEIIMEDDKDNTYQNKTCTISYAVEAVQGNATVSPVEADTTYIYTANDLRNFAKSVNVGKNSYAGKTVKLMNDIDLGNAAWTPIGRTGATTFAGVFDGQGYTVQNLNVDTTAMGRENVAAAGLFGWLESHSATVYPVIQNVKLEGVTVKSGKYAGGVVGYTTELVKVEGCSVKNATVLGTRAGAVVGYRDTNVVVSNCSADTATVSGTDSVGKVVGMNENHENVTGCTATDVKVLVAGQEAFEKQAIAEQWKTIELAAGSNITMVNTNYDVTIAGTKEATLSLPRYVSGDKNTITFKGITIQGYDGEGWYTEQLVGAKKAVYEDCTVKGLITVYCDSKFEDCVFENTLVDQYSIFDYAVSNVVVTGCTFNTLCSKAIKLYSEGAQAAKLEVESCVFNTSTEDKAAVEIDSSKTTEGYTVVISNCDINGAYKKLFNDKSYNSTVTVDGKLIAAILTPEDTNNAAKFGEVVTNAKEGATIILLAGTHKELEINQNPNHKNLIIEGVKGNVVEGIFCDTKKVSSGFVIDGLTVRNVNFQGKGLYFNCGERPYAAVSDLTMENCEMTGACTGDEDTDNIVGNRLFDIGADSPGSNQFTNIVIKNCAVSNAFQGIRLGALYGKCEVSGNTISDVTHNAITLRTVQGGTVLVEGNIISDGGDRAFRSSTIAYGATVTFKDNTITETGDKEDGSNWKVNTNNGTVTFEGNTVDDVNWDPTANE